MKKNSICWNNTLSLEKGMVDEIPSSFYGVSFFNGVTTIISVIEYLKNGLCNILMPTVSLLSMQVLEYDEK